MDQAEQLRNVIKLQNQNNIQTARVITVTSGKGGVGKSNITVNLAIQLQKAGKRVIIFDADFGLANVEVMFGTIPKHNLSDLIYHGKSIQKIITKGPLDIGFISGGSGVIGLNNLYNEQIQYLVNSLSELNELADFILIDTGAGISDQVLKFVMASPEVIMVTTPEPSSLTDAYSLLKALHRNPNFAASGTKIRVISNKVASAEEGEAVYDKLNSVVEQFLHGSLEYLGMVPQDAALERSVRAQKPVSLNVPNSPSAKAFESLAGKLLAGTEKTIETPSRWGISQLFSNFLSRKG
jgi:flagellar biosynthesis protein FlhG